MPWCIVVVLLILTGYIYFKVRYTTRAGAPTWYALPLVGILPVFLLHQPLFKWAFRFLTKAMLKVCLTWLLVRINAIQEMQLKNNRQSRPSAPFFNFIGSFLADKETLRIL